jgi:hypothetical protein
MAAAAAAAGLPVIQEAAFHSRPNGGVSVTWSHAGVAKVQSVTHMLLVHPGRGHAPLLVPAAAAAAAMLPAVASALPGVQQLLLAQQQQQQQQQQKVQGFLRLQQQQ